MSAWTAPQSSYTVTMEQIVRYAGASGDFTPIHYDPDTLASSGYDRFFAMGMLVAGHLGSRVVEEYGEAAVRSFSVRFHRRSWVGSTVTIQLHEAEHPGEISLQAWGDGELIASGRALVSLSEP